MSGAVDLDWNGTADSFASPVCSGDFGRDSGLGGSSERVAVVSLTVAGLGVER